MSEYSIVRSPLHNKDRYYLGFAQHAATASKDPSTQVGAVLVGPDGEVRLTAYNGPPRGVLDKAQRFERPIKYLFAAHAEANLIAFAAREGIRTRGCTVYVTIPPCAACARTLIQAGVAEVVCGVGGKGAHMHVREPTDAEAAYVMCHEAGVTLRYVKINDGDDDDR